MSDENVDKKYELTDEVIEHDGRILHRIRALRDVRSDVPAGTLGGYVEREDNLSHCGDAWVYGDAWVFGNAKVFGDARVCGDAWVHGDAWVYGDARVRGDAEVHDNARVCGNAEVHGEASVHGDAWVYGDAWVFGNAKVFGDASVYGNAWIYGDAKVCGDARVCGDAEVHDNAEVCGNADYMVFKNTWSSGRWFTCFREMSGALMWSVGCFYGTGKELVAKAYNDSQLSGDCYKAAVEMAEKVFAMTKTGQWQQQGGLKND